MSADPRASDVVVRTDPLGGSPLAQLVASGTAPAGWLPPLPRDAAGWRDRADAVRADHDGRWAERLAPAMAASGPAAERLARVAAAGGVVVTTGQQPGLFGGPVYTWSKALSALALADALEAATGIPTAPVFWAATDDADFAEGASTWLASPRGTRSVALDSPAEVGRPLAEVPLPDCAAALDALAEASGSAAWPVPLEIARRAYADGATVGDAYVALLRGLLEPLGVAVLDAAHPAVRAAGDALLRDALRAAAGIERAVAARDAALREAGHAPQVSAVPGLSLVSARDESGGKTRVPAAAAAAVADDAAAALGATVLLRPVLERQLLPTVAYVAGPGELAYFAQVGAVADALGAAQPLPVPRWSCTLVEPHVARLLARHGLGPDNFAHPHEPERAAAARRLPDDVRATLDGLRRALTDGAGALATGGAALLPPAVAEGYARRAAAQLDRVERRFRAAVKRSEAQAFGELAALRGALRPAGSRQERALNLLPVLARHGHGVLDDMMHAARAHAAGLVGARVLEPASEAARDAAAGARAAAGAGRA